MTSKDRQDLLIAIGNASSPQATAAAVGGNATLNATASATIIAAACNASSELACNTSNASDFSQALFANNRYWVLLMLLVPLCTIFGNVLVVLAVCRERSLQCVTNYFIVSLAFADILVAAIVMPVSAYVEVRNGHWDFGNLPCDLWIMCDALFSTASILNLVAISIDRFIAVTQPIKYSKHKNSKRTHITIAATWLLSVGIALPIGCGLQNMNGLRYREQFRQTCTFFNGDFLIYSSLGSFYIPCAVMLVLYYRIFKVIRERAKKASTSKKTKIYENQKATSSTAAARASQKTKKTMHSAKSSKPASKAATAAATAAAAAATATATATATAAGGSSSSGSGSNRAANFDLDCLACRCEGIYTGEQAAPHTCTHYQHSSTQHQHNSAQHQHNCIPLSNTHSAHSLSDRSPSNSDAAAAAADDAAAPAAAAAAAATKSRTRRFFRLRLKRSSSKKVERTAARREKKATKTLAIVLGVFLLCWLPFFITNLMWAACLKNIDNDLFHSPLCEYDRRISVFIVWLGYMNSFMNPMIYTIFNNEFRKAFKKLLQIN